MTFCIVQVCKLQHMQPKMLRLLWIYTYQTIFFPPTAGALALVSEYKTGNKKIDR